MSVFNVVFSDDMRLSTACIGTPTNLFVDICQTRHLHYPYPTRIEDLHLAHTLIHLGLLRQRAKFLRCQLEETGVLLLGCDLRLGDVQLLLRGDGLGLDFLQ